MATKKSNQKAEAPVAPETKQKSAFTSWFQSFTKDPKNAKILVVGTLIFVFIICSLISSFFNSIFGDKTAKVSEREESRMCATVNDLDSARFFGCKNRIAELEAKEKEEAEKAEAEKQARRECAEKNQNSEDGMGYRYDSLDGVCEKYETEKSCQLRGLKLYGSNCISEADYNAKKAEEAELAQLKSQCEDKGGTFWSGTKTCKIPTAEELAEKAAEEAKESRRKAIEAFYESEYKTAQTLIAEGVVTEITGSELSDLENACKQKIRELYSSFSKQKSTISAKDSTKAVVEIMFTHDSGTYEFASCTKENGVVNIRYY